MYKIPESHVPLRAIQPGKRHREGSPPVHQVLWMHCSRSPTRPLQSATQELNSRGKGQDHGGICDRPFLKSFYSAQIFSEMLRYYTDAAGSQQQASFPPVSRSNLACMWAGGRGKMCVKLDQTKFLLVPRKEILLMINSTVHHSPWPRGALCKT